MIQQGQVFKLKTKGADGQPLWAYRYGLEGRGSERPQVGGFATRAEAETALCKVLDRLGPGGGRATITLAEFVDEYLEMHQAAPVTIAKLRWLLGKATAELGEKRLADLSPRDVYAWRFSVPEGHRFEATQALRQVLNRAVCWGLIDFNPCQAGRSEPGAAGEGEAAVRDVAAGRSSSGSARAGAGRGYASRRARWRRGRVSSGPASRGSSVFVIGRVPDEIIQDGASITDQRWCSTDAGRSCQRARPHRGQRPYCLPATPGMAADLLPRAQ